MDKDAYSELRDLQNYGWNARKESYIKPNNGSETFRHQVAKLAAFHVLRANGYIVNSEVENDGTGREIDILAYGNPDRLTYAVECETSPTRETIERKVDYYVGGPIQDILVVNVSQMDGNIVDALGYVSNELGMEP